MVKIKPVTGLGWLESGGRMPLRSGGHPWLPVNAASSRVFLSVDLKGLMANNTRTGVVQNQIRALGWAHCAAPCCFGIFICTPRGRLVKLTLGLAARKASGETP
ncbi:MAG: hypothetical protein JWR69_1050 [Pedosphaera sp.]|nr:hypothetical protein [Pedosphaera sp.]